MRSLSVLVLLLLGVGAGACAGGRANTAGVTSRNTAGVTSRTPAGSASKASAEAAAALSAAANTASPAPPGNYERGDADKGDTDPGIGFDDKSVRLYGHAAGAADKRAIAGLVRRYYAAAAGDDGAAACGLMVPRLAAEPNLGEAAEAAYPLAVGLPPLHGKSCAQIMSVLFKEAHRRLAAYSATLRVTSVRLAGRNGYALLGFRTAPEHQMPVVREGVGWRVGELLEGEIP